MKVLIVVRTLNVGGLERVAVNLADAFHEAGHHCELVYFKKTKTQLMPEDPAISVRFFALNRALRNTGIGFLLDVFARLILNPIIRKSHFYWVGWFSGLLFKRYIKKLEAESGAFDLIIFRGQGTFEAVYGWHDPRHRFVLENIFRDNNAGFKQKLFAKALFDQRQLIAVSNGVAESARVYAKHLGFIPKSLAVISNPCPINNIRKQATLGDPDIPKEPYIVNVARLVPQKDQDLLLRAYARANIDAKLVIVGEGPLRVDLETLADELKIADRVIFAGNRVNPYPWMRQAECLVLSSSYEGLGIVLLEALACGTAIMSVDCPGGVRDVFQGELEAYLTPQTVEGLALGLNQLFDGTLSLEVNERWLNDFEPATITHQFLDTIVT